MNVHVSLCEYTHTQLQKNNVLNNNNRAGKLGFLTSGITQHVTILCTLAAGPFFTRATSHSWALPYKASQALAH